MATKTDKTGKHKPLGTSNWFIFLPASETVSYISTQIHLDFWTLEYLFHFCRPENWSVYLKHRRFANLWVLFAWKLTRGAHNITLGFHNSTANKLYFWHSAPKWRTIFHSSVDRWCSNKVKKDSAATRNGKTKGLHWQWVNRLRWHRAGIWGCKTWWRWYMITSIT